MLKSEYVLFSKEFKQKSPVEKREIILKLHQQFSHASSERIKGLLANAGVTDVEHFKILDEIPVSCDICKIYKKAPPRPVVGLSLAKVFNETVAIDLKEWTKAKDKIWFLHAF